jgi:hypothetical protein
MTRIHIITSLFLTLVSCGNSNSVKEQELALRERELALKERELSLQKGNENSMTSNNENFDATHSEISHSKISTKQTQPYKPVVQQKSRQLSEQEIRDNLYNKEASNPSNYLSASGTYRVNIAANTIVEGTIYNNASIAGFKNVQLTAKFYSKTDVLIAKESFLVMDFIAPNGSIQFKEKIYGWWENIDHWTLSVASAEPY